MICKEQTAFSTLTAPILSVAFAGAWSAEVEAVPILVPERREPKGEHQRCRTTDGDGGEDDGGVHATGASGSGKLVGAISPATAPRISVSAKPIIASFTALPSGAIV